MKAKREQFFTASELHKRGWTDSLVRRLLGDRDERKPNPHYRSGPPMRLYKTRRVERAEVSADFREAQEGLKCRREAARKSVATKQGKVEEYLEAIEIEVPRLAK